MGELRPLEIRPLGSPKAGLRSKTSGSGAQRPSKGLGFITGSFLWKPLPSLRGWGRGKGLSSRPSCAHRKQGPHTSPRQGQSWSPFNKRISSKQPVSLRKQPGPQLLMQGQSLPPAPLPWDVGGSPRTSVFTQTQEGPRSPLLGVAQQGR